MRGEGVRSNLPAGRPGGRLTRCAGDRLHAGTGTTLTGLPAAATYSLTVRARDAAGNVSNPSYAANVTTSALADTTPPTAPVTPAASEVTASSLTLAWSASSDDVGVIGYDVLQKSGAGDVQVASTAGTSASLTGLSPSTSYTCFVRARDASGNTSPAARAMVTRAPLAGPTENAGEQWPVVWPIRTCGAPRVSSASPSSWTRRAPSARPSPARCSPSPPARGAGR